MPLEWPSLDDLRFQTLVDGARTRIVRYCPEWTEYNVSDPGITLIELFAWMTDQTVYRLNQLPLKNYVAFLNMLGVRQKPATSARTELTFRLSTPFVPPKKDEQPLSTLIEKHFAVSTNQQEVEPAIFTTENDLFISPALITYVYAGLHEAILLTAPLHNLRGGPFYAFEVDPLRTPSNAKAPKPNEGAFFCIGLEPVLNQVPEQNPELRRSASLRGYIVMLTFKCDPEKASGHRDYDPPLLWECWVEENDQAKWLPIKPSREEGETDTTKGFGAETGQLTFYLPLTLHHGDPIFTGRNAYWLRCQFKRENERQPPYTASPLIKEISCAVMGATTTARHASFVLQEEVGISDGKPGQTFHLQHAPILDLAPKEGETLEIEESVAGANFYHAEKAYKVWDLVPTFANSCCHDRHYCLDTNTGEVTFGPGIVQPDGTVRQYGRIPESGSKIMIARYRYGGGLLGNVPPRQLTVMRAAKPYVDRVININSASNGCNPEELNQTIMRAQQEMFDTHRAVTAEDFEKLALQTDGDDKAARAKVMAPAMVSKRAQRTRQRQTSNNPPDPTSGAARPLGGIQLLVTPSVPDAVTKGELASLAIKDSLRTKILEYLEPRRLLTTFVEIGEPRYIGVKVETTIVGTTQTDEDLQRRVKEALCRYITPVKLMEPKANEDDPLPPNWVGWPFGQSLLIADLFTFIQKIKGVKHVLSVQISTCEIEPSAIKGSVYADADAVGSDAQLVNLQPTLVTGNRLELDPDTLLCSLNHVIQVVTL